MVVGCLQLEQTDRIFHSMKTAGEGGCLPNQRWQHWNPPSINRDILWNSLGKIWHCGNTISICSSILLPKWKWQGQFWRVGEVISKDLPQNQQPYLDRWRLQLPRFQLAKKLHEEWMYPARFYSEVYQPHGWQWPDPSCNRTHLPPKHSWPILHKQPHMCVHNQGNTRHFCRWTPCHLCWMWPNTNNIQASSEGD